MGEVRERGEKHAIREARDGAGAAARGAMAPRALLVDGFAFGEHSLGADLRFGQRLDIEEGPEGQEEQHWGGPPRDLLARIGGPHLGRDDDFGLLRRDHGRRCCGLGGRRGRGRRRDRTTGGRCGRRAGVAAEAECGAARSGALEEVLWNLGQRILRRTSGGVSNVRSGCSRSRHRAPGTVSAYADLVMIGQAGVAFPDRRRGRLRGRRRGT